MMKFVIALALVAMTLGSPVTDEFSAFKEQFGKVYHSDSEEAIRRDIFLFNSAEVKAHNERFANGLESYTVGLNEFSDMTAEEFTSAYTTTFNEKRERNEVHLDTSDLADSVDWRSKGAVTPVKNQGQCGSCWSFSTTGSVEGAAFIASGKLVSLSEQQLMDCSHAEGNHGCEGGLMDDAFKYIIKNGGLDTEEDYFYKAKDEKCVSDKESKHAATITGFTDVPQSEEQLMAAINKGPVAIAIEADQRGFQTYKSGVFTGPCGQQLDHGVLAVGYGTEDGKDYWLVKNSWGASWGDSGYIKIARGSNLCGITNVASYPTGANTVAAPEKVTMTFSAPMDAPTNGHYEDPGATHTCSEGEIAVQIQGLSGDFCSPACSNGKCPTDVPDGATAKPECVLTKPGASQPTNCALICTPGSNAECPTKATCKAIQGTGLCTYDS